MERRVGSSFVSAASVVAASPFAAVAAAAALLGAADPVAVNVPAGTAFAFHVAAPISSNGSHAGSRFAFVLVDPLRVGGRDLVASGTQGSGCILVAGHAGTGGHEGDITLRFDALPTADGRQIAFADETLRVNGRNRKIASALLGFVPIVGLGATFIRGSEIRIDPSHVFRNGIDHAAPIVAAPSPSPSDDPTVSCIAGKNAAAKTQPAGSAPPAAASAPPAAASAPPAAASTAP